MDSTEEQLAEALAREDYESLENAWLELMEAERIPAERLAEVIGQLVAGGQGARALDMVMALAPELVRAGRHAEALPLLRAVAPAARGNEDVRGNLIECYRALNPRLRHLAACLDRSGLINEEDLGTAVAKLERLLSYRVGDYFYHSTGWGLGQIEDFDPLTGAATIDFEHKPGHTVPLETIETIFERLNPDDFRVLRKREPEALRRLAEEDPAALVRKVMAANQGRISVRSLREALTAEVMSPDAWGRWWSRARKAITRDPLVAIGQGTNPVLTLRAEGVTYESEMAARFASLKDLHHKTELLREYVAHKEKGAEPGSFLLPAAREIAAQVRAGAEPGPAFEASLLLTRVAPDAAEFPSPEEIVVAQSDPIPLLNGLTTNAARGRALELLKERSEAWPAVCQEILLRGPKELWDVAAADLPTRGEAPSIEAVVGRVLEAPQERLELFAYVCRNLLAARWDLDVNLTRVFDQLLNVGDELAREKAYQRGAVSRFEKDEALALIRQSFRAGGLAYFDRMLEQGGEAEAARLLFRIRQSRVLGNQVFAALERKILRKYPKLLAREEEPVPAAADYIYNTPEAIERRRKEHNHLVNVQIPRNSEDIRRAAAMGDVSDNADWRSAIQEQSLLHAKAAQMAEELQRARPIEPSMVSTDHVSIGTRVTVENAESGERTSYTILGPWDADAERGIIAYVAPLAQALMGKRVGEEATLVHHGSTTTYRVLSIENALGEHTAGGN